MKDFAEVFPEFAGGEDDNDADSTVSSEEVFGKRETAEERRQRQKKEAAKIGEEGWPEDAYQTAEEIFLEEAIEHFGLMTDGSRAIDLRNPKIVHGLTDFRNKYAASLTPIGVTDGKLKLVPVTKEWLESTDRKEAFSQTFHPGKGVTCLDPRGHVCFNTWRPLNRVEGDDALAQPFIDHVAELFGEDAARFLDWLAHIEQKPGELSHTGWLHIADHTGTGRNWISSVLARVWAGYAASNFDLAEVLKTGFNDRLASKLLAQVDEIREGGGEARWAHHEKLKSMVNPEYREINPKYGRKHVEHNVCRWLIFSNSVLAIPLEDNDRRWEVVRHVGKPRSEAHYARLYARLNDRGFINAVAMMLRNRDISQFNPGSRARVSSAKQALIEASKSETVRRVESIIRFWPIPWIDSNQLRSILFDEDAGGHKVGSHVKLALRERGAVVISQTRVRLKGSRALVDIWQLRGDAPITGHMGATRVAVEQIEKLYDEVPKAGVHQGNDWAGFLETCAGEEREGEADTKIRL